MDVYIHNIKAFRCLVTALVQHTKHKTMRVAIFALGGLLDVLMVVDFTHCRKADHLFLFHCSFSGCCIGYRLYDCQLAQLSAWECYIAKYP